MVGLLRNVATYLRPGSVEEAVALVQSMPQAAYVAGGAWLVAQGDSSLVTLVDLQNLGIGAIEATLEDVRIGAMASLQAMIDHPDAGELADGLLAEAAGYVQSRNLREQGSVGGTLITGSSADPLTTALLVLDVEVFYADPVVHKAPFMSFVAYRERLIKAQVLLTHLRIKRAPRRSASAFAVVGRSPKDKPIVCVAAHVRVSEGLPEIVRLAVGGAHTRPTRLHKAEHMLQGQLLGPERIEGVLEPALEALEPVADFRGGVAYRRAMAKVLTRRALAEAWERARRA